jgi:hypothetical protein
MIARLSPGRAVRGDWAQAGLVALLLFCLYAATAPRTVALEDDGLFVLSSYFLGIEHPPGYPLYVLLGKLFTYLPVGSVAYRVHLLSALFGGLTCAMLWMCARTLLERRLPAYVAALALGLTPVFWSQALIAEVYTFNTLFFTALVFGLSLSNHWPLMLLAAPALAVLIWPLRGELPRSFGNLIWLVVLGLLPYAWMVWRSWTPLPISFHGPLERVLEIWYFISREGYAHVDHAPSAGWLDRAKFFRFMLEQLFYQFAVIGTALAAAGFYVQWRLFGRRIAAALTLAFLMPSFVLVMLLGFDYDSVTKHMFHVYPLPAYAVAALWAGVGCTWLVERLRVSRAVALAGSGALIGLILALGSRSNLLANYDWAARYARAVLHTLPRDANLFVHGDADFSIAYFNMIENLRPDVTLYHSGGLVLGNRLFHPLRTPEAEAHAKVQQFILDAKSPVALTAQVFTAAGRRDRWLHHEVDRSSTDRNQVRIEISEEAVRFFEESVLDVDERNPWIAYHQDELRRRYAILLGERLRRGEPLDPRSARHLKALSEDFFGAMGRARALMPADATKAQRSSFFFLRGLVRMDLGDRGGAVGDLETAVAIWSVPKNPAVAPLRDAYQHDGNAQALSALAVRVKAPAP